MEKIIKFKSFDGKEFHSETDCIKHESLVNRIKNITSILPKNPDTCDFANGHGYIQHNPKDVKNVKLQLLELCKEFTDHKWIQQTIDDDSIDLSFVARLIGEYDIKDLYKAWYRLQCIDTDSREWGQIYYRTHQNQAENICLNSFN